MPLGGGGLDTLGVHDRGFTLKAHALQWLSFCAIVSVLRCFLSDDLAVASRTQPSALSSTLRM